MRLTKIVTVLLLFFGLGAGAAVCAERDVVFSDDFNNYKDGDVPTTNWSVFSGHWFVKDGTLHQDTGNFDCGLVVKDLFLRCDYRMEAKVRLVGGGSGVGWYWNVYDALTGDSGNMLRYDGEFPIMYGWMRGRGFVGTGGATGDFRNDGKWHTMVMDVRNSDGTFDMYWDGKKIIDRAYSFHRSGYAGLECSLGHSEFDDFKLTVEKGTDWHASPNGVVNPEWVQSVAVMPDGNIVYPVRTMQRVQIVSPDGKLVRQFGVFGEKPGQFNLPSAVAVGKDGKIYVVETGNDRVQVFDSQGKPVKMIQPEGDDALNHPFGIAVSPDGKIWVGDVDNKRIVQFNADGSVAAKTPQPEGEPVFKKLMHLSFIDGKLYAADSENMSVLVYDGGDLSKEPQIIAMPDRIQPQSVDYDGKGTFVVSMGRGLATFDKDWNIKEKYFGNAEGEVWSYQSVFDKAGNIVVSDWWEHRILIIAPSLVEVDPKVSDVTTNSAVVSWSTDLPTPTTVMLLDTPQGATWPSSVDYSKAKVFGSGKMETEHKVELSDLKAATRHTFAITSPKKMIPATGHSKDYRFVTAAPKGMMAYSEVPLAILCYSNVTFGSRPGPDGKVPAPAIRDEAWFEHMKKNHEAMRYFYWLNSYFRLDTRCFYLRVTRPVEFAYLGSSSEEVYKDLETLAKREGMKPEDFGAVLVVGGNGTYAYPWPTPWWGGRLTYTTGCCFCGGGDTWIGTHEFHHLTEGWMRMIGYPTYTCADTPWIHPGRIGENYDFLADTLRIAGDDTFLNLAVGKLVLVADKDGDGVPDDAPITTMDEKRAGTKEDDKFTYQNGLTDLQNLTAEVFHPGGEGPYAPAFSRRRSTTNSRSRFSTTTTAATRRRRPSTE